MASTVAPPAGPASNAKTLSQKTLKGREPRTDRTIAYVAALVLLLFSVALWAASSYVFDKSGTSGRTVVGYTLGIVTILLYGLTAAYSWRHKRRQQKRRMTRVWMEIHLAFGVVAGVTAILHSGPHMRAPFHAAFLICWLMLIGSGILGKLLSVVIPRRLTAIEDEALLVEDVVERQAAMRLEIEQLLVDADEKFTGLVNEVVPKAIKAPNNYGKRRMRRADVVEEVYKSIDGDAQVPEDKRDVLKRLVTCLVEEKFLGTQLNYHYMLRAWLPVHVVCTTLCFPWLIAHVVAVLLL